ncbi:MAG: hypothetical protein ACUVWR_16285 [Anaerolineae bacterium]
MREGFYRGGVLSLVVALGSCAADLATASPGASGTWYWVSTTAALACVLAGVLGVLWLVLARGSGGV